MGQNLYHHVLMYFGRTNIDLSAIWCDLGSLENQGFAVSTCFYHNANSDAFWGLNRWSGVEFGRQILGIGRASSVRSHDWNRHCRVSGVSQVEATISCGVFLRQPEVLPPPPSSRAAFQSGFPVFDPFFIVFQQWVAHKINGSNSSLWPKLVSTSENINGWLILVYFGPYATWYTLQTHSFLCFRCCRMR